MPAQDLAAAVTEGGGVHCQNLTKYFGGVQALGGVSITLTPGEVLCLVGDNGAGKSTLSNIISGQLRPDAGELRINGIKQSHLTPRKALELGISVVPQTLALCDNLNASQNVMLGFEPVWFRLWPLRFVDSLRSRQEARAGIEEIGVHLDSLDVPVRRLSGGQRQAIAIARAMVRGTRVVIFDEPTAALGLHQTEATLDLIKRIAARGVAVMMISHALPDVMRIADRIVGLRHGELILDKPAHEATEDEVEAAMGLRTE